MWFSVEAIFKGSVENEPGDTPIYDRAIFLIDVPDGESPEEKSLKVAKLFEDKYKNERSEDVKWEFLKILEIQDLCEKEIYDGIEVFSRMDVDETALK